MKAGRFFAIIVFIFGFSSLFLLRHESPMVRFLAGSAGMIWLVKVAALLWQSAEGESPSSVWAALAFLFMWPGVSVSGFTKKDSNSIAGIRFLESWLFFLFGTGLLLFVSVVGHGNSLILNYAALLSILFIVHLGLVEVAADCLRLLGFSPQSLFNRPYLASSLRDFWSFRWNRAFVDMNKIFLLKPLRERFSNPILIFSIFLVSGFLHELGISFADSVSWGKPLSYFLLQGIGMELERHRRLPRLFVWLWILIPLPLLFTVAFTNLFLGGLARFLGDKLGDLTGRQLVSGGFLLGGILHLLVLCASVQVPGKLGWHQDFKKLQPLNRKVFWTYGAYIFFIIVFMSIVSFVLAKEPSSVAAALWAAFIALFWWARVGTDFFYMNHDDWPEGPLFKVGHVCLTTVFVLLAVIYSGELVWTLVGA